MRKKTSVHHTLLYNIPRYRNSPELMRKAARFSTPVANISSYTETLTHSYRRTEKKNVCIYVSLGNASQTVFILPTEYDLPYG